MPKQQSMEADPHAPTSPLPTHFAPAERSNPSDLQNQLEIVSNNPVVDGVMKAVNGLLAVLNERRQIIVVNETLLDALGIQEPSEVFGLRPGEAVHCIHAEAMPGGCGTSTFCSSCGAAIAIVSALGEDGPAERQCAVTVERLGRREDLMFQVRAYPMTFGGQKFILLFLSDITEPQWRAALERMFFHDANNLLQGLKGSVELLTLVEEPRRAELLPQIQDMVDRLAREVEIQSVLAAPANGKPRLRCRPTTLQSLFRALQDTFENHPVAQGRVLHIPNDLPDIHFETDVSLTLRILTNMLTNAFEATARANQVRLWVEVAQDLLRFCVWNRETIPESIAPRIFQRNFSTKDGTGRGLGTYAMKLFGEQWLGGTVDFASSPEAGTVFRFSLPLSLPKTL